MVLVLPHHGARQRRDCGLAEWGSWVCTCVRSELLRPRLTVNRCSEFSFFLCSLRSGRRGTDVFVKAVLRDSCRRTGRFYGISCTWGGRYISWLTIPQEMGDVQASPQSVRMDQPHQHDLVCPPPPSECQYDMPIHTDSPPGSSSPSAPASPRASPAPSPKKTSPRNSSDSSRTSSRRLGCRTKRFTSRASRTPAHTCRTSSTPCTPRTTKPTSTRAAS